MTPYDHTNSFILTISDSLWVSVSCRFVIVVFFAWGGCIDSECLACAIGAALYEINNLNHCHVIFRWGRAITLNNKSGTSAVLSPDSDGFAGFGR